MTTHKSSHEVERVWLLAGAALAALFLLRTAGMIFQGAVTGLGMFVAIWVVFGWFPGVKALLFSFGGVFDLIVSFGLPYLISRGLGITGGTMMIATMACGLMFTFTLATRKLGGPVSATVRSGSALVKDSRASWEAWRKDWDGRHQVVRSGGDERDHPRGRREREEEQEGPREDEGPGQHRVVRLIEGRDYTVS